MDNRRAFFHAAVGALGDAAGDEELVVLTVDADRFKAINDAHGHAVGDEALRALARRLRDALPPEATLGRAGGDVFATVVALAQGRVDGLVEAVRDACTRVDVAPGVRLDASVSATVVTAPTTWTPRWSGRTRRCTPARAARRATTRPCATGADGARRRSEPPGDTGLPTSRRMPWSAASPPGERGARHGAVSPDSTAARSTGRTTPTTPGRWPHAGRRRALSGDSPYATGVRGRRIAAVSIR